MSAPGDLKQALIAAIPRLRAFAISLCGALCGCGAVCDRRARADDLVQETLTRDWAKIKLLRTGIEHGGLAVYHLSTSRVAGLGRSGKMPECIHPTAMRFQLIDAGI